jgi:hypothetical protein
MNPHAGYSGRSKRRDSRWHYAPHSMLMLLEAIRAGTLLPDFR